MGRGALAFLAGLGSGYLNASKQREEKERQDKIDQIKFDEADRAKSEWNLAEKKRKDTFGGFWRCFYFWLWLRFDRLLQFGPYLVCIDIVTHNANLVVNTDAEQIIVAENQGENIRYKSGSVEDGSIKENKGIKADICNILEGGSAAFEKRERKYGIQELS